MSPDEAQLRLLQLIQVRPDVSQREMARELGLSLGKTNYCLKALINSGWVKVRNFRNSQHKLRYGYRLTPAGVRERAQATLRMLQRKSAEYEALRGEIERLHADAAELGDIVEEDRTEPTA